MGGALSRMRKDFIEFREAMRGAGEKRSVGRPWRRADDINSDVPALEVPGK